MATYLRGINSTTNKPILQKAPDAALMVPMMVGGSIPVKSKRLPNTDIVAKNGWLWLRPDRAFGSIGKALSSAQIKSDALEYLYLEWGGLQVDWDAGTPLLIPDYRGRVIGISGQGTGLSPREVGDSVGEEQHLLIIGEIPYHNHGGGNHRHGGVGIPYSNTQQAGGPGGCNWSYSSYSNNIINPQGGNQPHNNMQPSIFFAHLCFLGVQI